MIDACERHDADIPVLPAELYDLPADDAVLIDLAERCDRMFGGDR